MKEDPEDLRYPRASGLDANLRISSSRPRAYPSSSPVLEVKIFGVFVIDMKPDVLSLDGESKGPYLNDVAFETTHQVAQVTFPGLKHKMAAPTIQCQQWEWTSRDF